MKDRFSIIDEDFGEGGFGKIIVVNDEVLERKVALKKLSYQDAENRERFNKEAKILASLSHPNIPAIYDVDFSDTEMYIEFQFIEGDNLRVIISKKAYPSMEEARKWFSQISLALEYAHSKGILHRDIKPENIIISANRTTAYLVDFGIALSAEDTRNGRTLIGTPGYLAPEAIDTGNLTDASDIFSLGITLYEAFTGSLPVYDKYNNISDTNETVSPAMDELIKKCIPKDASLRLQSAREFHDFINSTMRIDVPFSSILTESRLYEIQQALKNMSAEDFHAKPLGQRLLVISRVKDLEKLRKPEMLVATSELLKALISICIFEEQREFEFVFTSSLTWGFEIPYSESWIGNPELRISLGNVCKLLNSDNCKYASDKLLEFVKNANISDKPKWYLHDLRPIVMSLLSNQNLKANERNLADLYAEINAYAHRYADTEEQEE